MPPIKVLDAAQQHHLLIALRTGPRNTFPSRHAPRNLTLALLMLDAGLRVGEVVNLSRQTLKAASGPTQTLFLGPDVAKTQVPRTIPATIRLVNAINLYLAATHWLDYTDQPSCAFPTGNPPTPITVRQVEYIIHEASIRALNFPVTCHSLRHTFATRIMRTASIRIVQDLLGHKRLSSTQIYTHPTSGDLRKAVDAMSLPPDLPSPDDNSPQPEGA